MAEAFGLAAGVLQVAGFGAEVGSALWACAKKIRYADKELRDLAAQVEATAKCLRGVGSLLDDPDTKALHTSKLYDDTSAVSKGCYEVFLELDKAVKKINDGKSKISMVQRLQWPLNSDKLTQPLKILKNYNDVLHLMLTVLHIVEGRRAATSDELRTLGETLQRLTTSNENLSQSNKALTDILSSQNQITQKKDSVDPNSSLSTQARGIDGPVGSPFFSLFAIPTPRHDSVQPPQLNGTDATHDHLQRCMNPVQELANTIACAMSAWRGGEKNGSSDIHGSHDKVIAELGKLSRELKCQHCSGRVSWADFDLAKAARTSLGSCTCEGRTCSSFWTPHDLPTTGMNPGSGYFTSQKPAEHLEPPRLAGAGGEDVLLAQRDILQTAKEQSPSDNEKEGNYTSIRDPVETGMLDDDENKGEKQRVDKEIGTFDPSSPEPKDDSPFESESTISSVTEITLAAVNDGRCGQLPHHHTQPLFELKLQRHAERAERISRSQGPEHAATALDPKATARFNPGIALPENSSRSSMLCAGVGSEFMATQGVIDDAEVNMMPASDLSEEGTLDPVGFDDSGTSTSRNTTNKESFAAVGSSMDTRFRNLVGGTRRPTSDDTAPPAIPSFTDRPLQPLHSDKDAHAEAASGGSSSSDDIEPFIFQQEDIQYPSPSPMEPSRAVQELFSRWLGDDANTFFAVRQD